MIPGPPPGTCENQKLGNSRGRPSASWVVPTIGSVDVKGILRKLGNTELLV